MQDNNVVAFARGSSRKEAVRKSLELISPHLNGIKKAKSILIKPNLTSAYNQSANTSCDSLLVLLDFMRRFDKNFLKKNIFIAEKSGEAYYRSKDMGSVFHRFGIQDIAKRFSNVKIIDLENDGYSRAPIETLSGKSFARIPKTIKKYDFKISLCLPKTHDTATVTLGIKNYLMGIIKLSDRQLMHGFAPSAQSKAPSGSLIGCIRNRMPWRVAWLLNNYVPSSAKNWVLRVREEEYIKSVMCMNTNLFNMGKVTLPDLTIIDGWTGMEGNGPVYGLSKKVGWTISSTNSIAADCLAAKQMGFDPEKIGYLNLLARRYHVGLKKYCLIGDNLPKINPFKPHSNYKWQKTGCKKLLREIIK